MKTGHICNKQSVYSIYLKHLLPQINSFANRFSSASGLQFLKYLYSLNVHHAGFINFNPKASSTNYYLMTILLLLLIAFVLCYNIKKGGGGGIRPEIKQINKMSLWLIPHAESRFSDSLVYYRQTSLFWLVCFYFIQSHVISFYPQKTKFKKKCFCLIELILGLMQLDKEHIKVLESSCII